MSRRTASWLAWLLWALCAALVALGFVFLAMSPLALIPEDLDFSSTAVVGVFALSFATVGALVGAYRPRTRSVGSSAQSELVGLRDSSLRPTLCTSLSGSMARSKSVRQCFGSRTGAGYQPSL